jgi:hypothetical protein
LASKYKPKKIYLKMEKKDNSGALFTNNKREKETHPHYQGKATINGVEYYVSSWVNESKSGKFLSLSFKPVQEQAKPTGKPTYGNKDFDDFLGTI